MVQFIALMLLILFTPLQAYSSNTGQARQIFHKIVAANGFKNNPILVFSTSDIENASSGWYVTLNYGMLRMVSNSDELAFVIGHELAHAKTKHANSSWAEELKADRIGLQYMQNAGYNRCMGAKLLLKFGKASASHPSGAQRYQATGC